jgi:multidrug transporter EmrE-like cation transporter
MALGFIWYSKFLFLKSWQEDTGMTDEKMKAGNMPMMFGGMLVMVIISTISLALLIGTGDLEAGLAIGTLVGFGIAAARVMPQYMFAQQPNRLAMMQSLNLGIGILLTGVIIGTFNA